MKQLDGHMKSFTQKAWHILLTEAEILGKTTSAIKWYEVSDDITETIAINRKSLVINEDFWMKCSLRERVFLLAHEASHLVQMLLGDERINPVYRKEPVRLGRAMDYAINSALRNDKRIGEYLTKRLVKMGCFPEESGLPPMKSLEYYFEAIGPQDEDNEDEQKKHIFLQSNEEPTEEEADENVEPKKAEEGEHRENEEEENALQDIFDRILNQEQDDPLVRNLAKTILPKEDQVCISGWKEILRDFLWRKTRTQRSYKRPSRRWDGVGPIIPGKSSRDFPKVALILDFSGSMEEYLKACAASIVELIKQVSGDEVYIVGCGSEIQYEWIIKRCQPAPSEKEILSRFKGGMTDMRPAIKAAKAWGAEVILCVSDMGVPVENIIGDEVVWITQKNNELIKAFREVTGCPKKRVFDVLLVEEQETEGNGL